MAIYHFSGQVLGRKSGTNQDGSWRPGSKAVAAAAYRSGERLQDHHHRQTHDYSGRRGVVHAEVLVPPGAAPWLADRALLWNTVEGMETRKDAQLAREFNMALPHELTREDRIDLVRDFAEMHFVRRGMVADIALHDPIAEEGQSPKNFHAHVMLTMRRATARGLDPVKTREWNSRELLKVWRIEWELACNRALERAGKRERVDHRTLKAQREEAIAAHDRARAADLSRRPEIHVGPQAKQATRPDNQPKSRVREVGAYKQREGAAPQRRRRDYPGRDEGSRLNFLEKILTANNADSYRRLKALNHRMDRVRRKVDYWERRAAFHLEGIAVSRQFRFNRWKAGKEAKAATAAEKERKAAHARRRLAQIGALMKALDGILRVTTRRRETGLVRMREVERWIRRVRSGGRSGSRGRRR
ncbi:hypothetical protein ASD99_31090 [Mesorhizobium sp. Root695]|uniref:MobQ family relaxase n=1 Tax=Mesorhizobium sp. Root695 TaxID=1736589 RepID=UPI00070BD08C|nr:MobQ family relaxase [Mesorhizobium sp. Root695]KRB18277.1 hypothetical protein ASD99_31090 [Mesorhizobium sp. Root695]